MVKDILIHLPTRHWLQSSDNLTNRMDYVLNKEENDNTFTNKQ